MKQYRILFLLMIPVVAATIFFTARITTKLSKYEEKKIEKAERLNAETRLSDAVEWIPDWLWSTDAMEDSRASDNEANQYYASAVKDGIIFLLIVIGFLIAINLLYKMPELRQQAIGLSLIIASVCFLYLGLNEPFIEIEAYYDDPEVKFGKLFDQEVTLGVDGRVYFFYQNKSVLKLIQLLYNGGNFFVAIMIIVFSILFPAIKLISSFFIFLSPNSKFSKRTTPVIDKLGKWSMADVFVASSWLAYFSFANTEYAIETGANTLIGLYFFTAFVIFSMVSGIYLKRTVIKSHQKINGG